MPPIAWTPPASKVSSKRKKTPVAGKATSLKTRIRIRFSAAGPRPLLKNRSERRSAPPPGSATHGYRNPHTKPPDRRPSRHCSRVRRPRFPHLAPRPHPSKHGSESASTQPGVDPCSKIVRRDVRRRDRGQRPQLQKKPWPLSHILQDTDSNPLIRIPAPGLTGCGARASYTQTDSPFEWRSSISNPAKKPPIRRQSRHCSWGRWPRFPHLAPRPHPSRRWLRIH